MNTFPIPVPSSFQKYGHLANKRKNPPVHTGCVIRRQEGIPNALLTVMIFTGCKFLANNLPPRWRQFVDRKQYSWSNTCQTNHTLSQFRPDFQLWQNSIRAASCPRTWTNDSFCSESASTGYSQTVHFICPSGSVNLVHSSSFSTLELEHTTTTTKHVKYTQQHSPKDLRGLPFTLPTFFSPTA